MERQAKLYICMAMAKSSRLLRNWKKDLNSSKVMPWSWKKRVKIHRGKINLLIGDIQPSRQSCHKLTFHSIPFLWATLHHTKSTSTICISYPSESVQQTNAMMDKNKSTFWYTKGIRRCATHACLLMHVLLFVLCHTTHNDTCVDERHESFYSTMSWNCQPV